MENIVKSPIGGVFFVKRSQGFFVRNIRNIFNIKFYLNFPFFVVYYDFKTTITKF